MSPVKGHEQDEGIGASDIGRQAERAGTDQPGARCFSVVSLKDDKKWAQTEIKEIQFKHKKNFFTVKGG